MGWRLHSCFGQASDKIDFLNLCSDIINIVIVEGHPQGQIGKIHKSYGFRLILIKLGNNLYIALLHVHNKKVFSRTRLDHQLA